MSFVEGVLIAVVAGIVLTVLGGLLVIPKRISQSRVSRRLFVPSSVTPAGLCRLRDGHTDVAGDRLVKPYVGKWMKVTGSVGNIRPLWRSLFSLRSGYAVTIVDSEKDSLRPIYVAVEFAWKWRARLDVMPQGTILTAIGRITTIRRDGVSMDRCELVEG